MACVIKRVGGGGARGSGALALPAGLVCDDAPLPRAATRARVSGAARDDTPDWGRRASSAGPAAERERGAWARLQQRARRLGVLRLLLHLRGGTLPPQNRTVILIGHAASLTPY